MLDFGNNHLACKTVGIGKIHHHLPFQTDFAQVPLRQKSDLFQTASINCDQHRLIEFLRIADKGFGKVVEVFLNLEVGRTRAQMQRGGVTSDQLEEMLSAMRGLDRAGALTDPDALVRLRRDVVDGAKELEFALRRALLADRGDSPRVRGSGQVAEEFRRMVEEYYRALARQP